MLKMLRIHFKFSLIKIFNLPYSKVLLKLSLLNLHETIMMPSSSKKELEYYTHLLIKWRSINSIAAH